jgi:hypothetical protein
LKTHEEAILQLSLYFCNLFLMFYVECFIMFSFFL